MQAAVQAEHTAVVYKMERDKSVAETKNNNKQKKGKEATPERRK